MGEPCIETFQLSKIYNGKPAVDAIHLQVERGSFYGFLGPNGAGKSTTIKMLTGIIAPSSGTARLLGLDLARQPLQIKRRIGVVPEDLCLFENLTAREYLTFVGRMYRMPKPVVLQRSAELLSLLGLDEAEKKLTIEFSHGMKKKLSLARRSLQKAHPETTILDHG